MQFRFLQGGNYEFINCLPNASAKSCYDGGQLPNNGRNTVKNNGYFSNKKRIAYVIRVQYPFKPNLMKHLVYLLVAICCPMFVFCQDITGLWKGTIYNDSTQQFLQYEIYISKVKGKYTGYSNTCFLIDDKTYYGIKKINVRFAKDGKIIMQDAELLEHNYPVIPNKNVYQLNVLDLSNTNDESTLDGLFVTNRSKDFHALTGHVSIKRVDHLSGSYLTLYLQNNNSDNNLTAVK